MWMQTKRLMSANSRTHSLSNPSDQINANNSQQPGNHTLLKVHEYLQVQQLLTTHVKEINIANVILEMATKQVELERSNHFFENSNLILFASVAEEISAKELKKIIINIRAEEDAWDWGNANEQERNRAIALLEWKMPSPLQIRPFVKYDNATIPAKIVAIERRMRGCTNSTYTY